MGLLRYEDWEEVIRYWPGLLILAGLFMIVGGEASRSVSVFLIIMAAIAGIAYHSGKFTRNLKQDWWNDSPMYEKKQERNREKTKRNSRDTKSIGTHKVAYELAPEIKEGELKIDGGAGLFKLKEVSNQLFEAHIESNVLGYQSSLKTNTNNGVATIVLKQDEKDVEIKNTKFNNDVNLMLNPDLLWVVEMNLGAGKAELDLRKFRVKELNIDAGVSALEIKLGDKTDRQDIKIDSGLAALDIWFPRNVGCEVKVKGELNLADFDGFENVSKGLSGS